MDPSSELSLSLCFPGPLLHAHSATSAPPAEYESDMAFLQQCSQDELVQLLRSDGRRQVRPGSNAAAAAAACCCCRCPALTLARAPLFHDNSQALLQLFLSPLPCPHRRRSAC